MSEFDTPYFERNMALLNQNHPHLRARVCEPVEHGEIVSEVRLTDGGKANIFAKSGESEWVFLHDSQDPGKESDIFLSMVPEASTGVVLMFGMGLGYSVGELLKKRKTLQFLIVFEANIEFFIHAMRSVDLSLILADSRVIICLGEPEDIGAVLHPANKALMLEDIHTLNLLPCFEIHPGYQALSSKVFDYINSFNTEGATQIAYGKRFFDNRLKHLTSIHHDRKLEELKGAYKNVPAIIVAAGPSLDKNIDQIKKAKGNAIIIAVDTVLPNLLNHGVVPDFLTAIDFQSLTFEKLSAVASDPACKEVNLVCMSWITERVPKLFPAKNIFWAFADKVLESWINVALGGKMAVGGAGTVAHLNFVSARIMGCEPIIFVGQDLAFTGGKGHASHVLLSTEDRTKKMLDSGQDIIRVKGVTEPEVATNRQMYGYKNTFEDMIQAENVRVINATEGGAHIKGTEPMPLGEAIERFCQDSVDTAINPPQGGVALLPSIKNALGQVRKELVLVRKVDKLIHQVRGNLKKISKKPKPVTCFANLPGALQSKISTLDKHQKKSDQSNLWPLFDELTMVQLRDDEREKREIEKLETEPGNYLDWLANNIHRVDRINKIRMENLGMFKDRLETAVAFHDEEQLRLKRLCTDSGSEKDLVGLLEAYLEFNEFRLIEQTLEKFSHILGDSKKGISSFYQGLIALYRSDYPSADIALETAVEYDSRFLTKIEQKRKERGDYYYDQAKKIYPFSSFSLSTIVEGLLLNGLRTCPGHKGILNEFNLLAEQDVKTIGLEIENEGKILGEASRALLHKWMSLIDREKVVLNAIAPETLYAFYRIYGRELADGGDPGGVLEIYQKALSIRADDPDLHISMADLCFSMDEFDRGLAYLQQAVSLDVTYSVYWKNMGDNLKTRGDYAGAVLAYEQYFISSPNQIESLKWIGDCHAKLGNLTAAREAYQMLKDKLNGH